MSTAIDPTDNSRGLAAGMIATYPGYTVAFPTASVFVQLQVNNGAPNSAALVTSQDGQYLRGFTNPLRTGDYSTSVVDPATGLAWLVSVQFVVLWEEKVKGETFCFLYFSPLPPFLLTHKKYQFKNLPPLAALGAGPDVQHDQPQQLGEWSFVLFRGLETRRR